MKTYPAFLFFLFALLCVSGVQAQSRRFPADAVVNVKTWNGESVLVR